jgi:hypothetical protein
MDMLLELMTNILEPLMAVSSEILRHVPSIGTALIILLLGSWACMWIRVPVDFVFRIAHIDDHARRLGLSEVLTRLGLGGSLAHVTRVTVTTAVFLGFFLAAADAMGLSMVREYLRRMLEFAPTLLGSIMILGGGLYLGEMAGRIIHRAADANHVRGSEGLMRVTHGLVVIFSGVMALRILGLNIVEIVLNSMPVVMAAVGLAFAIAFGVAFGAAGKDMASRWIRDLTPTASKPPVNGHEPRLRVAMKVAR